MNWLAWSIIGIWLGAAIDAKYTKDSSCFGAAMVASIVLGIVFFFVMSTVGIKNNVD